MYGKVDSVIKPHVTISFQYDPGGNRVGKTVISSAQTKTTWYVRDAQGNVISTYDNTVRGSDTFNRGNDSLGMLVSLLSSIYSFEGNNAVFMSIINAMAWYGTDYPTALADVTANDYASLAMLVRSNWYYMMQFGTYISSTFNMMPSGFPTTGLSNLPYVTTVNRFRQGELYLYGSKRLGVMNVNRVFNDNSSSAYINPFNGMPFLWSVAGINHLPGQLDSSNPHFQRIKGLRNYELTNHLGNVLVTITDRRPWIVSGSYFGADVVSANDYYAFGSEMVGRVFIAADSSIYRCGFNGQEKDDEIYGAGNLNTAEFWEYDARLGRRWNLDPVSKSSISNYLAFSNSPVRYLDPNGDDWFENDRGYFIWSDLASVPGFDYAGNNLPEGVDRYRILVSIDGKLYHKNTTNVFAVVGNYFGGHFVEHEEYSRTDEEFTEELVGQAVTFGALKLGGMAWKMLSKAGGSLWNLAPFERGFVYEAIRGGNLVKNYPVIDYFYNGVAKSIKTLDLNAETYKTVGNVFNKLKGYIDNLNDFKGDIKGGVNTTNGAMKQKILDVGIPRGATREQVEMIKKAIDYGANKGIKVEVNIVK